MRKFVAVTKKGSILVGSCMRARTNSTHLIFLVMLHTASITWDRMVVILLMLAIPENAAYDACGIATVAISLALCLGISGAKRICSVDCLVFPLQHSIVYEIVFYLSLQYARYIQSSMQLW